MIKVYTIPSCLYCSALKDFLTTNNIKFVEIDISKDIKLQDEFIEKTGKMNMPFIDIDGKIMAGFDKDKISEILNL